MFAGPLLQFTSHGGQIHSLMLPVQFFLLYSPSAYHCAFEGDYQASGPCAMAVPSIITSSFCRQVIFLLADVLADYIANFFVGDAVRVWNAQGVSSSHITRGLGPRL